MSKNIKLRWDLSTLPQWKCALLMASGLLGSHAELSLALGKSRNYVYHLLTKGQPTAKLAEDISRVTGGRVQIRVHLKELDPDLYKAIRRTARISRQRSADNQTSEPEV